jgi:hypothetical protein
MDDYSIIDWLAERTLPENHQTLPENDKEQDDPWGEFDEWRESQREEMLTGYEQED